MAETNNLASLLRDFAQGASNSVASNVGMPVDILAWMLRKGGVNVPSNPVGGTDWMAEKGLTREPQNKLAGLLGDLAGFAAPIAAAAKAPQIAKGLLSAGEALPMGSKAMPSGGGNQLGAINIGDTFKYPQSKAIELAQQRAALPTSEGGLGLPANNTAMDRANVMFPIDAYHETTGATAAAIDKFNPLLSKSSVSDFETPYAVFTKPTGVGIGLGGENVAQMPLRINIGKQGVYTDRDSLVNHAMYDPELSSAISGMNRLDKEGAKNIDKFDSEITRLHGVMRQNPDANEAYKKLNDYIESFDKKYNEQAAGVKKLLTEKLQNGSIGNFDSVRIKNDAGSFGRKVDNTMIFNPDDIRSRFAAFDPWRRNAVIAASMGVAAPDLLAKDNNDLAALLKSKK